MASPAPAAEGPGIPNENYPPARAGEILSTTDPGKALSATALHRGYLFVPLGADHGGGQGAGAFAFYDVSNPSSPTSVFDSRDDAARYHTAGGLDYAGDWAEVHHLPVSGDLMLISERRSGSAGFSIFDASSLYDEDPATKPRTISRYSYSGVTSPSNYDGYSFALGWQGRRYVYAPTGAQGLYVIDTTDLNSPVQLQHMSRASLGNLTLRAAWPIGNLLILAEGNVQTSFQARIYDIGNPGNPVQIGAFNGPLGYNGFVYGSSFYGGGTPIARHDFANPAQVVRTNLFASPGFDRPEYGYGKDGVLFIGHYPGATKWILNGNSVTSAGQVNSGLVDDHAFLNPLGNLVILCSDHNNNRKMMIGIHGAGADSSPPQPLFTSPANGATNQNVLSRVGISFSDFVDPNSLNSTAMKVRNFATGQAIPGSYSAMMGIVNFAPDEPLEANMTYEVLLGAGGIRDQVGNAVPAEILLARFSTGSALHDYVVTIPNTTPLTVGGSVNLPINVANPAGLTLEHSWDFGDGSPATAFSSATTAFHTYTVPGNHNVAVSTRVVGQTSTTTVNNVQLVHRPIATTPPVNHSTITVDPARPLVWNVNPDHDSVTAIDTASHTRAYETAVGDQPKGLAIGPNDTLWVVSKGSATLSVIDRATGTVTATHPLPAGSAPHGLIIDAAAGHAYVTLEAVGQVAKISTATGAVVATLEIGSWPRGLALDPQRRTLWVSRFISPDAGGVVTPVDLDAFATETPVALAPAMDADSLTNGRGIPNYLAAPVLSPDLAHGFVPAKKDNIFRGQSKDGQPLTFETTVRSMAANLDLATGAENPALRLDFDNSDFATAAVFSPLGNQVFFATSGSATIWVVDAYNPLSRYTFQADGLAPDGLALNADGSRLYIHNFMDRSVTVFRTPAACGGVCGTAPRLAKIATTSSEALSPQVLRGKQIFYDTSDPRLAQEGYMSCASCHLDGGHDGRTWDFTNLGEGLRNTIDLTGRGAGHGPAHWSANFDESQDFEGQIRGFASGSGLMADAVFHHGTRSQPLGESKTGLAADLDALAAYIASLNNVGRSPHRNADGSLGESALLGREIFRQENCASCHGGTAFTDSASMLRHDVGTLTVGSGKRLGVELDGLDTPTLRGLWKSAPYLHDGSAMTLRDIFLSRDLSGRHAGLFHRSAAEIDQLTDYLLSIDDWETEAPSPASSTMPVVTSPGNQSHEIHRPVTLALSATGNGLTWQALALPPGLELDPASGRITGTPTIEGDFTARVGARDAAGHTSTVSFAWKISNPTHRRYVKLVSLSSHLPGDYTGIAEFNLIDERGERLNRSGWIATANTSQLGNGPAYAIDNYWDTFWNNQYSGGAAAPFPHELVIDLGQPREFAGFSYLPRQTLGSTNSRIKDYQFYWSNDGLNWGSPIKQGTFSDDADLKTAFIPAAGPPARPAWRYVMFESLSSYASTVTTVIDEFNLLDSSGNPLPRTVWTATANTQEPGYPASNAIDGILFSRWNSVFSGTIIPYPHRLTIDLGNPTVFHGFSCLPRTDAFRLKDYRFYVSNDGVNWGAPATTGTFPNSGTLKPVIFYKGKPPVFSAPLVLAITENSVANTLVGTVSAAGSDAGESVSYSLGSGNIGNAFTIDPTTGTIRVAGTIDYESHAIYHLQVIATCNTTPSPSASLVVPVIVNNVIETNGEAVNLTLSGTSGPFPGHGNPALVGFDADPDKDGTPNAIELLLGTDPDAPDTPPPVRIARFQDGGKTYLSYEYDVAEGSGLSCHGKASVDLGEWEAFVHPPEWIGTANGLRTYRIRDHVALEDEPKRFMRLEVEEAVPAD